MDLKFDPMAFSPMRVGQWGFLPMFAPPLGSGRQASTPLEMWISFFPTAPFFGVRWMFADVAPAMDFAAEGRNEHAREKTALNSVRLRTRPKEETAPRALPDIAAVGGVTARFSSDAPAARLRVVEETPKAEKPKAAAPKPAAKPAPKAEAPKPDALKPAAPKKTVAKKAVTGEAVAEVQKAAPAAKAPAKKEPVKKEPAKKPVAKAVAEKAPAKAAPKKAAAPKKPAAPKGPKPTKKPGHPFATYDAAPPTPDDLTRIKGVGEKLAAVLNDRGIYMFAQIAEFDAAAYQWLDDTLGAFKGRGKRDDWAGQAKALMKK